MNNSPPKPAQTPSDNTDHIMTPKELRSALGHFPTGVIIATTQVHGEDLGMTISSFNSLSLDPPLVLFSINKNAHGLPKWQESKGVVINVLAWDQIDLSNKFATPSDNKWENVTFSRGVFDAPILANTCINFECNPYLEQDAGDHILFIMRILSYQKNINKAPLVYCHGQYGTLKSN